MGWNNQCLGGGFLEKMRDAVRDREVPKDPLR